MTYAETLLPEFDHLALFDKNVATARKAIEGTRDEEVGQPWTLLQGGNPIFTMPRGVSKRMLSQLPGMNAQRLMPPSLESSRSSRF